MPQPHNDTVKDLSALVGMEYLFLTRLGIQNDTTGILGKSHLILDVCLPLLLGLLHAN